MHAFPVLFALWQISPDLLGREHQDRRNQAHQGICDLPDSGLRRTPRLAPRSKSRRLAQTAIWKITNALVRLIAPILVFTSEEIWRYLPKAKEDRERSEERRVGE